MTLDERLNAVTMNLELTAREVMDLRESVSDLRISVSELHEGLADLRGSVDGLAVTSGNLLRVCEAHERRLTRVEGIAE
jgi:hypothetical protein